MMTPQVLEVNEEFLVLVKPAGLLMHGLPNKKVEEPTLADWLQKHYPETAKVGDEPTLRPGLVHRLDKDTSGLILVARTQEYFLKLKKLFEEQKVQKTYLALVRGYPERDRAVVDKPLGIKKGTTKRSVRSLKMVKKAITEYLVLQRVEDAHRFKSALLEVKPHTGRTHQIRVHLTSIGHPILGDRLYGPALQPGWVRRLMLHALSLEFDWAGKKLSFCAEPDSVFIEALQAAGCTSRIFCIGK